MTGTNSQVWVKGFVLVSEVVQTVYTDFFESVAARVVLATRIAPVVDQLSRPAWHEAEFYPDAIRC